jgi:WD40 repeat protein/serine/threonine protein kinase
MIDHSSTYIYDPETALPSAELVMDLPPDSDRTSDYDLDAEFDSACDEYFKAMEDGERPDHDRIIARHPKVAELYRKFMKSLPADFPQIPDYEIMEEVERGGMGIVFKARRIKDDGLVALKTIIPGLASPGLAQAFLKEIETLAKLNHPHIIPIFHTGTIPACNSGEFDGQPFFTMKWIEGGSLKMKMDKFSLEWPREKNGKAKKSWRKTIPLRAKRLAVMMARVSEGVHHAHQFTFLHRDLKPGNILIDSHLHPYVADFGLVLQIDNKAGAPAEGTAGYMAPEQAAGADLLSARVDVYGLGAVLYHLITGRPPFDGKTRDEILAKVREHKLVRPRKIQPHIPRELEAICLKCLKTKPEDRYRTAHQVRKALSDFIEGRPVAGLRTPWWRKLAKWVRRQPAWTALIVVVGLSASAGVEVIVREFQFENRKVVKLHKEQETAKYNENIQKAGNQIAVNRLDLAAMALEDCPPDRRNIEWSFLNRACQPNAIELDDSGAVGVIANLANGEVAVTVSMIESEIQNEPRSFAVKLWNVQTKKLVRDLQVGTSQVVSMVSSRDGQFLAVARMDANVTVWDFRDALNPIQVYQWNVGGSSPVIALAKDGKRLASANSVDGKKVRLWDLSRVTGPIVKVTLDQELLVEAIDLSPDGRYLAFGGRGQPEVKEQNQDAPLVGLRVVDLRTNHDCQCLPQMYQNEWVRVLSFSPDGNYLIYGLSNQARILDIRTEAFSQVGNLPNFEYVAEAIAFDRNGKHLAISFNADKTRKIKIWEWDAERSAEGPAYFVYSAKRETSLDKIPTNIHRIDFDPAGNRLIHASGDKVLIEKWQARPGIESRPGTYIAFAPNSDRMAICRGKVVDILDTKTGNVNFTLLEQIGNVNCVAFSPDGTWLVTGSQDGAVRHWNASTGEEDPDRALKPPGFPVRSIAFSATNWLAAGCDNGKIHVWTPGPDGKLQPWDLWSGLKLTKLDVPRDPVTSMEFSPNGQLLATACEDGFIRVFSLTPKRLPLRTMAHNDHLAARSVAFSSDGHCIISGHDDHSVKLWEFNESEIKLSKAVNKFVHDNSVFGAIFSPDDQRVITVSRDDRVRVWDRQTGRELVYLSSGKLSRPAKSPIHNTGIALHRIRNRLMMAVTTSDGKVEFWEGESQGQ